MSSHDSVSMVLKCMLKGAADFLIKPIRRNELGNLWQHVWRRHAVRHIFQSFYRDFFVLFSSFIMFSIYLLVLSSLCRMLFIQSSTPTLNTTFSPKYLKTASEDNSASNKSSGSVASSKENNECSERLSEAQVSSLPQCCQIFLLM